MKKVLALLFLAVFTLSGCNSTEDNEKLNVVTTVYPLYDMVYQIAGEDVNLSTLYPNEADIHEYELTSKDIAKITDSDLFIYISDDSTSVIDGLKAEGTYNTKFIDLAEAMSEKKVDELILQEDPHIWLSPKQDIKVVEIIAENLINLIPEKKDLYNSNLASIQAELTILDEKYLAFGADQKNNIYVTHNAYSYLAQDYNIQSTGLYGLHHDDEPSAQEIANTIDDIKKNNIKYVYTEQNDESNPIMKQIANETDAIILGLNNLSTVSKVIMEKHTSFIELLENNLMNMEKIND